MSATARSATAVAFPWELATVTPWRRYHASGTLFTPAKGTMWARSRSGVPSGPRVESSTVDGCGGAITTSATGRYSKKPSSEVAIFISTSGKISRSLSTSSGNSRARW